MMTLRQSGLLLVLLLVLLLAGLASSVTTDSPSQASSSLSEGERVQELVFPLGKVGTVIAQGPADVTPKSPLTLCLWIKASIQTSASRILSYFQGNAIMFISRSGSMVSVRSERMTIDVRTVNFTPREWHHLCVIRQHSLVLQLFLDGRSFVGSLYPARDKDLTRRLQKNLQAINAMVQKASTTAGRNFTEVPLIVLGALDSKFDSPFGRFADLRIFRQVLTDSELKALRTCSKLTPAGDDIEVLHTSEALITRTILHQSLCTDDKIHVVTYPAYTRQEEAEDLCSRLGGTLPAPQTFSEFTMTAEILSEYTSKPEMFFWLSNSTNLTSLGVEEGQCCAQDLRYGGSLPMSAPCKSWARDFVCYIARGKSMFLLHTDDEIELFFGEGQENYLLLSDQGFSISFENNTYVIRNLVGGTLGVMIGQQISQILGMREWTMSNRETSSLITLSTCLTEEFTCKSGDCLPLEKRCDKWPDCEDATDEDDCNYLLPPPATYRAFLPPSDNTAVGLSVDITAIHDINMQENQLGMTVTVDLWWTDGRLTFTNMGLGRTRLDQAMGKIWQPTIIFVGAKYEDNVNLQKGINDMRFLYAESSSRGAPAIVNSSRALKHNGWDVGLQLQIILDLTMTCSYNLTLYPFDVQECGLALTLGTELTGNTHWDPNKLQIDKSLPQPALYGVSRVRFKKKSNTQIEVLFLLERWFGSYMLTTYLPCLILLVIGTSTLAYPVSALSDRVMVTLSCLIVLASLLAQASATLPESASSKAIEVWFSYTITRMFLVSVVHTAVYRSNQQFNVSAAQEAEVSSRSSSSSATSQHLLSKARVAWMAPSTTHTTKQKQPTFTVAQDPSHTATTPSPALLPAYKPTFPPTHKPSPQKAHSSISPSQRINRFGLILGVNLDLLFFAIYISYVVLVRRAIFASIS
ncbi:uncharacterized protein [Procambarus clarkii]|uniref:uncharacterized protein isoform X2 n=1 Tax=Procambarus clarkii TaxID=6728 RepID=UPI0037437FDD